MGKGRLALNFIHKIRDFWWSSEQLNAFAKRYISPSKSLNKKHICYLKTFEIPNSITYEGKHPESNCSGVKKNGINKNDNSCNTLQKLRVNNPLRIVAGQLNISSTRNKFCNIFKLKIDILLVSETYSLHYRLDKTCKRGGLLLYVRDNIPSKQIRLKFIEDETFEGAFIETDLKKVVSLISYNPDKNKILSHLHVIRWFEHDKRWQKL